MSDRAELPHEFVDAHHHFLDTVNNDFQSFLRNLAPNSKYLPEDYQKDVVEPLREAGVTVLGSVHVECMPDDGVDEACWVESMPSMVKAIVASCDLTDPAVEDELKRLKEVPTVRGTRWILDCVGPFESGTATHIATKRHDGIDYLRGSEGGYEGEVVPAFEKGFAALEKYNLRFDLQCAPVQLPQAARLLARHPGVKVCIDHLGKPRTLLGPDEPTNTNTVPNEDALREWRLGMKAMAELPQVYVKVSMVGFAVPGWIRTPERTELMRKLCRELVEMFGPRRCMTGLNWYVNGAISDADGLSDVGPDAVQWLEQMSSFFEDYSDEDRARLFAGTAREFYRF